MKLLLYPNKTITANPRTNGKAIPPIATIIACLEYFKNNFKSVSSPEEKSSMTAPICPKNQISGTTGITKLPVDVIKSDQKENNESLGNEETAKRSSWDSSPLVPEVDEIPF